MNYELFSNWYSHNRPTGFHMLDGFSAGNLRTDHKAIGGSGGQDCTFSFNMNLQLLAGQALFTELKYLFHSLDILFRGFGIERIRPDLGFGCVSPGSCLMCQVLGVLG